MKSFLTRFFLLYDPFSARIIFKLAQHEQGRKGGGGSLPSPHFRRFLKGHPLEARRGRCTSPTGVACVCCWPGGGPVRVTPFLPARSFFLPSSPFCSSRMCSVDTANVSWRHARRRDSRLCVCARVVRPTRGSSSAALAVSLDFDSSFSSSLSRRKGLRYR